MRTKSLAVPYIVWMVIFTVDPSGRCVAYYAFTDRATGQFTLANHGASFGTTCPDACCARYGTPWSPRVICLRHRLPRGLRHRPDLGLARSRLLYLLVMLPMCMSFLLRTLAWVALLRDTGIINHSARGLSASAPCPSSATRAAVIHGHGIQLPALHDHAAIHRHHEDRPPAHRGRAGPRAATARQVFRPGHPAPVHARHQSPGITMVFVPAVSTFYISQKLGCTGTTMIGDVIESPVQERHTIPNLGAAMSPGTHGADLHLHLAHEPLHRRRTTKGVVDDMKRLGRIWTVIVFLFLYAAHVHTYCRPPSTTGKDLTRVRGLHPGAATPTSFATHTLVPLLGNSVLMALLLRLLATRARHAGRAGHPRPCAARLRRLVMPLTNIPLTNPEIVTGVSLALLFVFIGAQDARHNTNVCGFCDPAHCPRDLLPALCHPLRHAQAAPRWTPPCMEAALDLGLHAAPGLFQGRPCHEIMPGIVSGAIMAFTMSLDDFVISYFVYGPRFVTLPVEIYNYTRKQAPAPQDLRAVHPACSCLILIVMVRHEHHSRPATRRSGKYA